MSLITWSDEYSVNVKEIDLQHQKLIGIINTLNDAMKNGKGQVVLEEILSELLDYTKMHFRTEEGYFDKFEYIGGGPHKTEHTKFVCEIKTFFGDFNAGKIALSVKLMNFLNDWLIRHINGTDKKYTKCFNENGLS